VAPDGAALFGDDGGGEELMGAAGERFELFAGRIEGGGLVVQAALADEDLVGAEDEIVRAAGRNAQGFDCLLYTSDAADE